MKSESDVKADASRQNRPAMMKLYVVFFVLGTFISGFGTVMAFWVAREFDTDTISLIFALSFAVLTVLYGVTVGGLYDMKKWGRNLGVVTLGIGIVLNGFVCVVITLISAGSGGLSPACGSIIGIPIQAYMLRWLWDNGQRFR